MNKQELQQIRQVIREEVRMAIRDLHLQTYNPGFHMVGQPMFEPPSLDNDWVNDKVQG